MKDVLDYSCNTPEAYTEPINRSDRAVWVDRIGELVDTMFSLDRLVILQRNDDGQLYCATIPEKL